MYFTVAPVVGGTAGSPSSMATNRTPPHRHGPGNSSRRFLDGDAPRERGGKSPGAAYPSAPSAAPDRGADRGGARDGARSAQGRPLRRRRRGTQHDPRRGQAAPVATGPEHVDA